MSREDWTFRELVALNLAFVRQAFRAASAPGGGRPVVLLVDLRVKTCRSLLQVLGQAEDDIDRRVREFLDAGLPPTAVVCIGFTRAVRLLEAISATPGVSGGVSDALAPLMGRAGFAPVVIICEAGASCVAVPLSDEGN